MDDFRDLNYPDPFIKEGVFRVDARTRAAMRQEKIRLHQEIARLQAQVREKDIYISSLKKRIDDAERS